METIGTSDEDSINDNNSVISLNSDGTCLDEGNILTFWNYNSHDVLCGISVDTCLIVIA